MVVKLGHFLKVDQKYLEHFETWCWRRMEISWTDRVTNVEVLQSQEGEEYPTNNKKEGRLTALITPCLELPSKTRY
jgi:hypothetical protein